MLRFRPIAPRPTSDGSGGKLVSSGERCDVSFSGGGGKKKCQQKEKGGSARRCTRRKRLNKTVSYGGDAKVTLSLLPVRPGQTSFRDMKMSVAFAEKQKQQGPFWLSFSGDGDRVFTLAYQTVEVIRRRKVVILLCRVTWTNEAYRKMARDNVRVEEGAPDNKSRDSFHVIVRLVMRERPMLTYTAFACRVKLQFTCQDRERCSLTVPCDVWTMDAGGFAWRLDIKAALSL
ncbi:hypothetical protein Bca101_043083 [Brassica carinata]